MASVNTVKRGQGGWGRFLGLGPQKGFRENAANAKHLNSRRLG